MWRVSRYRVSPGLPKLVQGLVHLMSPLVVLVPEAILMATLRDGFAHLDAQPSFVSHDSCAGVLVAVTPVDLRNGGTRPTRYIPLGHCAAVLSRATHSARSVLDSHASEHASTGQDTVASAVSPMA